MLSLTYTTCEKCIKSSNDHPCINKAKVKFFFPDKLFNTDGYQYHFLKKIKVLELEVK